MYVALVEAEPIEKLAKTATSNGNEEHNRKQPRARLQNDTSANINALFAGSHCMALSSFFYSCNCTPLIAHTHTHKHSKQHENECKRQNQKDIFISQSMLSWL